MKGLFPYAVLQAIDDFGISHKWQERAFDLRTAKDGISSFAVYISSEQYWHHRPG